MSDRFRTLLKKVGSGTHTSAALTREEAAEALRMMLQQEATPVQVGAFLIAHRIRRPTGEELAGMLDVYAELGPHLTNAVRPPMILTHPYDGRSRTVPMAILTGLILSAAGVPTILHGGDRMPTKEGICLHEIWQQLGINWEGISLIRMQEIFQTTDLGFIHLPTHFPLAMNLVGPRREIGKRPPIATLELMWSPYLGDATIACGYVHPPTESMFRTALELRNQRQFITVKGLEGSCDLPRDRTCIIGINRPSIDNPETSIFERLLLHPHDYGYGGKEVPLNSLDELINNIKAVLEGEPGELMQAAIWNGGFYLWCAGVCADIETGLKHAQELLTQGMVAQKLEAIANSL
ncbi:anthranilate phosphoribosyltransferase family protein [Arthrospira platensis FACHB-439]|uniref:anthranilate phosphoribosyltransferase family protein n=1 Tax=Limnospira TaxID=2596745 RepID=UPI00061B45D9|nr:anthranilate phosphoribosyltransferase family protein [Limnospira indica]MBD2670434.1 anthranilate phosphoribosyltransferase family protein [Arthrospira platensis FACHB-439]QNH55587.1 MAG: anthranilate phosphoribosyltransferase family protein [Limnospira indica BM01]